MSYKINDWLQAAVYVNGKEFPAQTGNAVQSIHMSSHSKNALPLLTITVNDQLDVISTLGLQDGVQLAVSFNGYKRVDRYFRVHSWKRSPSGNGFQYTIYAYWDSPRYFAGTTNINYRGSSSQVIAAIASACGLGADPNMTATSDSMLWVSGNQSYSTFAREIARRGYVDNKSYLGLAVDLNGVLRYRNLTAAPASGYRAVFTPSTKGDLPLIDFKAHVLSGNNNLLTGYRHSRVVQGVTTQQVDDVIDKLDNIETQSTAPLVSMDVRNSFDRAGISFSPIDFGNVHANYERARYQNVRISRLNSLACDFLFGTETPLEPLDVFTYAAPTPQEATEYDGVYIVTGKVIYVPGSSYYEKLIAVKMGL